MADFAHRCSHFRQSRIAGMRCEELLQVGVTNIRLSILMQRERYLQNDVTVAVRSIEDAGAVSKTALCIREGPNFESLQVENSYLANGLGDLLAIGADILHRRAAHRAGNTAQALQPGAVGIYGLRHQRVPIHARTGGENHVFKRWRETRRAGDRDLEHQAGEAFIGDDEVAATAQHEQWQPMRAGKLYRFDHLGFTVGFCEMARRSTHAERGEGSQSNLFANRSEEHTYEL